jgi:hypothetical protein
MLQRQLSHLNRRKLDHREVFKPLVLSMPGFALSYAANMFILMILYDFACCLHNFVTYDHRQSQISFTIDGLPPISSSWCQAP